MKGQADGLSRVRSVAVGLAIFGVSSAACAQTSDRPSLENTEAFRVAYGMSLVHLYGCGDDVLGQVYLRALMDKFDHCPFSKQANADFHTWARQQFTMFMQLRSEYISTHGAMPDRLDGMKMTCEKERHSSAYLRLQQLATLYGRGEITADDVFKDPCDVLPGSP